MNSFVNSLFSLLLGWFKALARTVWDYLPNLGDAVKGLADSWLAVALILILLGTVVDRAVWFFRWRPDKVWRTRLRKLRERLHPGTELPTEGYTEPVNEVANPAEDAPLPETREQPLQGGAEHRHVRTRRRSDKWQNDPYWQDENK